ncbi:MAG: hypothetical protein JXR96_01525 [Deltaproteobacteria bacterium]|nr:hypothetical protein [Deltaproteobacteria bacterium]
MKRCLLYSHRPLRLVEAAKELVARGSEILSSDATAQALETQAVLVTRLPSVTASSFPPREIFQLLNPRLLEGMLGDWGDRDKRQELEHLGIKRIDLVLVEIDPDSGPEADLAGAAILRAAVRNQRWVVPVCDPDDLGCVLADWDRDGELSPEIRRQLANKALHVVVRYDSSPFARLVSGGQPGPPRLWSLEARQEPSLPIEVTVGHAAFYRPGLLANDVEPAAIELLSGPAPSPGMLGDADLAWSCLEGIERPSACIAHDGLCGFTMGSSEALGEIFVRARALDPRACFGAVVAFNRELDEVCARAVASSFFEAVLAPAFSAEARALLGKSRTRLLRVHAGESLQPVYASIRWGLMLHWQAEPDAAKAEPRTLSRRQPDESERESLQLAWHLASRLRPVATVIADRERLLSVAAGQTSWHDAARLAVMKMPPAASGGAMACNRPIRFAEDVEILHSAGVEAVLHCDGSPRQDEITRKIDQLGMVVQVVGCSQLARNPS